MVRAKMELSRWSPDYPKNHSSRASIEGVLLGCNALRLSSAWEIHGARLYVNLPNHPCGRGEVRCRPDPSPVRDHADSHQLWSGGKVYEAACHRDVGDVHRPHLVRSRDRRADETKYGIVDQVIKHFQAAQATRSPLADP